MMGEPWRPTPPGVDRVRQLPALVAPRHDLALRAVAGREDRARVEVVAQARVGRAADLFGGLKDGTATEFTTAEATGPLGTALMPLNTLVPRAARGGADGSGGTGSALTPSLDAAVSCSGLTVAERVGYARALFRPTRFAACHGAALGAHRSSWRDGQQSLGLRAGLRRVHRSPWAGRTPRSSPPS